MRPIERDVLLTLLSATAGSADGWSFSGLGHVFVANMTGNTVLIGLAAVKTNGDVLHPLLALCSYAAGTALGSLLPGKASAPDNWRPSVFAALLLEVFILAGAEIGWCMAYRAGRPPSIDILLCLLACAVGLQSGVMLQLKIPGVVTTYITGTWSTLISASTRLFFRHEKPRRKKPLPLEERLLLQIAVIAAYLLSAALTGWLFRYAPAGVGALPVSTLALATLYGICRVEATSFMPSSPSAPRS